MNIDLSFQNWQLSIPRARAQQYDDGAQVVTVTGERPADWRWQLSVSVYGRAYFNAIPLTESADGTLTAVLTRDDLAFGDTFYTLQLVGERMGVTRHTNPVRLYVGASICGDGVWPEVPSSFTAAQRAAEAASAVAASAAAAAEASAGYIRTDYAGLQNAVRAVESDCAALHTAVDTVGDDLDSHTRDGAVHVTAVEKAAWNAKADVSDIPQPPVQSVNGKTGSVTVREVPDYSDAVIGYILAKTGAGTLGWIAQRELPRPTESELRQWLAELGPEFYTDAMYDYIVDSTWWDETLDGDITHFYAALAAAAKAGKLPAVTASDNGKIAIVQNGVWTVVNPPFLTAATAPVKSVNGKTGAVTISIPNVPTADINANTAARHTHANKSALDDIPDASGASVGQVLTKTANGLGWAAVDAAGVKSDDALQLEYDSVTGDLSASIGGLTSASAITAALRSFRIGTATFKDLADGKVYGLYSVGNAVTFARAEPDCIRMVSVGAAGDAPDYYTRPLGGLPAVTASDNGKFLRVANGAWAAVTVSAAEGGAF